MQILVVASSAAVEYRAMAAGTCKLMWQKHLVEEVGFG